MARIMALDIGGKRTGIAETDPLQIIASPRETVPTDKLMQHLEKLLAADEYEAIVLGDPLNLDGGDSDNSARVREFKNKLSKKFPLLKIALQDERFTSKMAVKSLVDSGMKKKQRRNKAEVDKVSAAIILQDYLDSV